MHYAYIGAILLAVAEKTSRAGVSQAILGEVFTNGAKEKEFSCLCDPASRLSALILGKELGVSPALPVLARRPIPPGVDIPDQTKRVGSSVLRIPILHESHVRVRVPAFGGTSTLSHGVAAAQEYRLRLKRP